MKQVTSIKQEYVTKLGLEGGPNGVVFPLKNSAAALCEKTLEQSYVPKTKESPYPNQKVTHRIGLNTQLTTPIIINGDKFIGCIVVAMAKEDAFSEIDRMLIKSVATMLGASIQNKRLKLAAESSNKISREILHSMIPPKVSLYFLIFKNLPVELLPIHFMPNSFLEGHRKDRMLLGRKSSRIPYSSQ